MTDYVTLETFEAYQIEVGDFIGVSGDALVVDNITESDDYRSFYGISDITGEKEHYTVLYDAEVDLIATA